MSKKICLRGCYYGGGWKYTSLLLIYINIYYIFHLLCAKEEKNVTLNYFKQLCQLFKKEKAAPSLINLRTAASLIQS